MRKEERKNMTREQIEKAIDARLDEPENHWDGIFNSGYSRGFRDGAQWRINAMWHKPSAYGEELKRDVEVIAKTKRGYRFGIFDILGCFHEYIAFVSTSNLEYALSDVLEYAYLADLLPEGKEEEDGSH